MIIKNEYNHQIAQTIYDEASEDEEFDFITKNEFSQLVSGENGIKNRNSKESVEKMSYTIRPSLSRRSNSRRYSKWAILTVIVFFFVMLYIPLSNDFRVPSRIGKFQNLLYNLVIISMEENMNFAVIFCLNKLNKKENCN